METERVRIIDIAEELGLSTATVSNVIHGKTKKISDETVKRVQELLEEKRYFPGIAGVLLGQNDSRIIGIVVNDHEKYEGHVLEDAFIAASLNALSRELERTGYFMMVKVTGSWNEIPRFASMWNMEGLVVMGFCAQDYQKLRESMHIPFVVYDGYFTETEKICNLVIDNYSGGRQAGEYLRGLGHRKVLCIADNYSCMDKERIEGFRDGFTAEEETGERQIEFMQIPFKREERSRFYTEQADRIEKYSAVFAVSDHYAAELMHFLQRKGMRIPEDISIIGFDDTPLCRWIQPPLTTVKQDVELRAGYAVEALKLLKAGNCGKKSIKIPVSLVVRASVSPII